MPLITDITHLPNWACPMVIKAIKIPLMAFGKYLPHFKSNFGDSKFQKLVRFKELIYFFIDNFKMSHLENSLVWWKLLLLDRISKIKVKIKTTIGINTRSPFLMICIKSCLHKKTQDFDFPRQGESQLSHIALHFMTLEPQPIRYSFLVFSFVLIC